MMSAGEGAVEEMQELRGRDVGGGRDLWWSRGGAERRCWGDGVA